MGGMHDERDLPLPGRSRPLFDRRTFLGAAAAVTALSATAGAPPGRARASTAHEDGTPVLDGAEWTDPTWRAIPGGIRKMIYQVARVRGVTRAGGVLPVDRVTPDPVVLLDRTAASAPLTAAYFLGFPTAVPGGASCAAPPSWDIGSVQICRDPEVLAVVLDGFENREWSCGELRYDGVTCYGVVPDHLDPEGCAVDDWRGTAVFWHEYVHQLHPTGPAPAPGWEAWDYSFRYPADDAHIAALAWLEQLVLAEADARPVALETFLAIREHRRTLRPDLITTLECRETAEGLTNHVEGLVLHRIGAVAHDPDGSVRRYPPEMPTDDQWWLNWFAGSIQYAGSAVFEALTRHVGEGWKPPYCEQPVDAHGMSSADLVRCSIPQPEPVRAAALVAEASRRHGLDRLEARIVAADLPNQDLDGPDGATALSCLSARRG
ncbi:hypothetical protein SAMN05660766_3556 [Curtobacterium sp. 314Chir4.1]|nr:hypothetical protein SAMN05660766_3556 [Curtobacterium sp. 314Chir4.1]